MHKPTYASGEHADYFGMSECHIAIFTGYREYVNYLNYMSNRVLPLLTIRIGMCGYYNISEYDLMVRKHTYKSHCKTKKGPCPLCAMLMCP